MPISQPKILVYAPEGSEKYAAMIRKEGYTLVESASSVEEARHLLDGTEVLLCWKFPIDQVELPPSLRWIQSMGAGVNDWLAFAHRLEGITLTRVVGQFGRPIAEYVFSYLLYLAKDIPRLSRSQQKNAWEPFLTDFLTNKTIGIAGIGSIGQDIIRKARAFDMNVHGLSFTGSSAHLVDRHYHATEWKAFLTELDYLVLTLPLTEQTKGVLNRELLLEMKPDACLVNVGRGPVIVEQDLVEVLKEGHLRAAVLDVFEQEPLPESHPFWNLPNVYVTPHISGPSMPQDVGRFFLENLGKYQDETTLDGIVDLSKGY